jgi:NAD(P)-dependent dehydrogenase (short-subunit alcohol dehydrogenase family)
MTQLFTDKIALVTGASRGIGKVSALALAAEGAHIVATARTTAALEELDDEILAATGKRATLVPLDLTEGDNIDQLGGAVHQRFGKLDILVHAGAMLGGLSPVGHVAPSQWDKVIATDLTASFRLIRSMEPLLKAAETSRAIFLTSRLAVAPRAFWAPYAASKAGLEALVRCWADEVEHIGIRAVLLDPGPMRTRMRAEAYPGEDPMSLPAPEEIGPLVVELAGGEHGLPNAAVTFASWRAARDVLS